MICVFWCLFNRSDLRLPWMDLNEKRSILMIHSEWIVVKSIYLFSALNRYIIAHGDLC